MGLRPAMTLKCAVAMVKPVKAGDGVSYGHTWIAERDTNLALLPIGYADGLYRPLGGRIDVLIDGRLRRSVGRVCMDQFVVDLGPGTPDAAEGDEAILFGPGTSGNRRPRTGPTYSAPSTTRWSPARAAGWCARIGRPTPVGSDETNPLAAAGSTNGWRAAPRRLPSGWRARPTDPGSASARRPGCWPGWPG